MRFDRSSGATAPSSCSISGSLPMQEVYRVYRDHRDVARAIKDMVVRGAPAIGVAAAMGIALGMAQTSDSDAGARASIASAGASRRRGRPR